jgi:hypothetical protein
MVADAYQPLAERAKGRYSTSFLAGVDRALQVLPHERPQSVSEFAALVGIDLRGESARDGAGLASAKAKQPEAANTMAKGFAICGIAIALAAGGWYALKHEAHDVVAISAPELVAPMVHAPSRPPDVPPLPTPPMIAPPAAVPSAPQLPTQKSFTPESHADIAPSHPVQRPPVRSNGVHIAPKGKPVPQREALRQAHATKAPDARSTQARAPRDAANESRTPKGGVTTMDCGDILHRISLGVSLPEDQQLMREKCQ